MADEILGKKISDLSEKTEPADTDVHVFGDAGTNVLKKIKWSNLVKKLRSILFVNNTTTTEAGYGVDARVAVQQQKEIDGLKTDLSALDALLAGYHYQIVSVQNVAVSTSGGVNAGQSASGSANFNAVANADVYIPVLKGFGWLAPGNPTISGNKISVTFTNIGSGAHSGIAHYGILAAKMIQKS